MSAIKFLTQVNLCMNLIKNLDEKVEIPMEKLLKKLIIIIKLLELFVNYTKNYFAYEKAFGKAHRVSTLKLRRASLKKSKSTWNDYCIHM